jgi:hypothetical protein
MKVLHKMKSFVLVLRFLNMSGLTALPWTPAGSPIFLPVLNIRPLPAAGIGGIRRVGWHSKPLKA